MLNCDADERAHVDGHEGEIDSEQHNYPVQASLLDTPLVYHILTVWTPAPWQTF